MINTLALIVGAFFAVNAVPHVVNGISGRPFPSPFATPPGRGDSAPVVNVLWGAGNLALAYVLLGRYAVFDASSGWHLLALGGTGVLTGTGLALHFGRNRLSSKL